jgi:hypothetical protein
MKENRKRKFSPVGDAPEMCARAVQTEWIRFPIDPKYVRLAAGAGLCLDEALHPQIPAGIAVAVAEVKKHGVNPFKAFREAFRTSIPIRS